MPDWETRVRRGLQTAVGEYNGSNWGISLEAGLSGCYLGRYFKGDHDIKISTLQAICDVVGCSFHKLLKLGAE